MFDFPIPTPSPASIEASSPFFASKDESFFCEEKKGSLNFARLDTWLFEKCTRGYAYAQNLETLLCYSSTFILIVRIDFKAFLEALVPPQHLSSIKAFLKSNKNAHFFSSSLYMFRENKLENLFLDAKTKLLLQIRFRLM